MKNKKIILALILPLLTSGLLISCKPKENDNNPQSLNPTAAENIAKSPQNNKNLEELQKTLTEAETNLDNVETSLESLNSNLREFVNAKDEDKKDIKIDFKPTSESWTQFNKTWVTLKDQLDNESRVKSSLNKGVNFEANENDFVTKLGQKITEIDAIIKLLNEPIIKEDKVIIKQLQELLGMTPSTDSSFKQYGTFGKITQGELQTKTTEKIKAIKDDINTVKEKIDNLLNSSDVSELKNQIEQLNKDLATKTGENATLTQQNKTIETDKQVLIQQINEANKKFIVTLACLLGLMTLNTAIMVLLLMRNKGKIFSNLDSRKRKDRKKNNIIKELENPDSSDEQNTVLKLENYVKQLVEEIEKLDRNLDTLTQINKKQEITISQLSQGNSYLKNQNTSNSGSQPSDSHTNSGSGSNLTYPSTQSALATKTPKITHQQELVSIYNANSLFKYNNTSIPVSTEPTSIETSRTGSGKRPILTEQSPSKYWIVEIGRDLSLVPKENALNTNDMTSVEVLFECWGYKKDVSNPKAFTLIKPGKVKEINGQWELVECGILDYR